MSTIYSAGRCTRNEDGFEEITVEFHKTFWQSLLNKPATTKKMVWVGGDWRYADTYKVASTKDWCLATRIRESFEKQEKTWQL